MRTGQEYELKFSLDPSAFQSLMAHGLLKGATRNRRTRRLLSTYYDTPDGALLHEKVSLRLRESNERRTQTLKSAERSMVDRDEWEHDSEASRPDLEWLRSTPLQHLFARDGVADSLRPRFTVDVARTELPFTLGSSEIEGALDYGTIRAADRFLDVCEFELELKAGPADGLLEVARQLVRDLPLTLALASKAERGFALADATAATPTKTLPLDLSSTETIGTAFAAIVQACLHPLCHTSGLIGAPDDREAVHKTRIILRHLRAGLGLFRPALRRPMVRAVAADLKWMSALLGTARDADVFQHGTFDAAPEKNDSSGAAAVAEIMRNLQQAAHGELRAALATSRWRLLLVDLVDLSMHGVRQDRFDRPCGPWVRKRLQRQFRRLARDTRGWTRLSADALHDIRKQAKMLRYALDLVGTLPAAGANRGASHALAHDLHTLQQTLGIWHDRIALDERLGEVVLRAPRPDGTVPAAWQQAQEAAARIAETTPRHEDLLGQANRAAKRLRKSRAFRAT